MAVSKPLSIAADPVKSRKWDEVTSGRDFQESDAPTIALLCQWHAIAERCMDDLSPDGETMVAYSNKMDDIKALPQIATLKQASAEIRALNKQLGIAGASRPAQPRGRGTVLNVIQGNRQSRAANRGVAKAG